MILMEVLKEAFNRRGYEVLLHEKPFQNMNGSGKHHNWSLNYIDKNGEIVNLFKVPKVGEDSTLFKLFVLINLAAIANNEKLYMGSIGTTGNELRLGGHEAPPRIISVFLGTAVSNIIDNKEADDLKNFRETLPNVTYDLYQENTDRNRTSPYAYTGNKFEFRAAGSSQNPSFIMATIAATTAHEIEKVTKRLEKGETLEAIMADLHAKTQNIRFDGNGYSEEWPIEAEKRGLYVNKKFS
jgi:glutamine synthetase